MATSGAKPVNCKLVDVGTLKLQIEDRHKPDYTGLVVLSADMLMVVERNTGELLLHSLHNGQLLAKSKCLQSNPWDICLCAVQGREYKVAVTLDNGQIQILSVVYTDQSADITPGATLKLMGKFESRSGVKALKSGENLLICGLIDGWFCWSIVSIADGNVNTVQKICKGKEWSHLATSPDDTIVYISCLAGLSDPNNGVYAFDVSTGSKQFLYQHRDLNYPSGISVDKMGFIYVCNYSSGIHQLTERGEPVAIHLEKEPYGLYAIYWEEEQQHLYITYYNSNNVMRLRPEFSQFDQQGDHTAPEVLVRDERKQPAIGETSTRIEHIIVDKGQPSVEPVSLQVTEDSENDQQGPKIPVEILGMDQKSQQRYKEALRVGKVKMYNIRVMVVGYSGVGKTTLTKRLLEQPVVISEEKRTEGIDIHKHCCTVSMDNREWIVQHKDLEILDQLVPVLESVPDVIGKQEGHSEVMDQRETTHDELHGRQPVVIGEQEGHSEVIDQGETTHEELHGRFQYSDNDTPANSESVIDQKTYRMSPQPLKPSPEETDQNHSACDEDVVNNQESGIPVISNGDAVMIKLVHLFNERVAGKSKKNMNEATVGMWDFAGQDAFHTTHQTFLTWRAIYLLVTDLSQEVSHLVPNDKCYFDTEGGRMCRVQDLVEVWLNSIHCCEPSSAAGIPVTNNETGTPVTSPSAGTPATAPSAGIPVISPSADTLVISPSSATPMTSSSKSPSTGTTVASPSISTTLIFPAVTYPAAGITVTSPKPDTAVTLPAPGTSVTSYDDVISATPPVILVGTHVDQIPKDKREEVAKMYFQQIRSILKDKPTLHHLVDFIAIDNTQLDPQLKTLKNKIYQLASEQQYWGEEVPTSYVLMEEALRKLKASGKKVILFNEVEKIDRALPVPIQTEKTQTTAAQNVELDLFLRFMHEIGTLIYFSVEGLRENIVLDPQWLIDAQKSLITAEMFIHEKYPDNEDSENKDIRDKWLEFKEQGKLTDELINAVWTKENNPEFHDNKELILKLLEQLNIIAKPMIFTENGEEPVDYFLAPCMLRQKSAEVSLLAEQDLRIVSTSVLCYVFTGKFLPPPIFHRLIAACVARWPVAKKKETSESLIFCGCCVFDLDLLHRLNLYCRNHVIFARITSMDEFKTPPAKLCTRVRRFITLNISKIISSLEQNLPYELRVQCPSSHGVPQGRVSEDGVPEDDMVGFSPPFQMWFEYEGHDPDAPITPKHMNHARLCVALVTICGNAMREILLTNFPVQYQDIYQAILANQVNLRQGRFHLNKDQIQLVFPDPQGQRTGQVDQFDLSLLYTLIRNVSTVPAPVTGWGRDPQDQPRDNSLGASVERIHLYRNHISGHSPDGIISQQEFEDYWTKIDAVLHDIEAVIGRQVYSPQLEQQKRQVISIYEAC